MPPFDHPCHLKLEYPPPPVRRFLLLSKHFRAPWSLHETQHTLLSFRISPIYFATQTNFFQGSWVPLTFFPATTLFCCWSFPNKHMWKNIAFEWKAKFVWVMRGLSSDINYFKNLHCTISRLCGPISLLSLDVQLYHLFLAVSMDIRVQSSLSKIEKSWKGLFFFEHSLSKW